MRAHDADGPSREDLPYAAWARGGKGTTGGCGWVCLCVYARARVRDACVRACVRADTTGVWAWVGRWMS